MRDHGGNLGQAAAHYGGTLADWIDLSTGINTVPYPIGHIPADAWQRLPEPASLRQLERAAQHAYGTASEVVPVAGAQAAIQMIPRLRGAGTAAVLSPTYNEHAAALRACGWRVQEVGAFQALEGSDLAIVVNPNNPDGRVYAPQQLMMLAQTVGLLIIDESFADADPETSLVGQGVTAHLPENVVVLRSFGKFYGLAGVRLGFVVCQSELARKFRDMTGPWPVSGMAIEIAQRALQDDTWAQTTRVRLGNDTRRLDALAVTAGWKVVGGTSLFRTYATDNGIMAQKMLAKHHIWSRIFPYSTNWIRMGLPGTAADWARLTIAMEN
tara:strand:+ start:243 stop:1220 length:978 start_codon:yes stop_codon:yes gene_type:complete